MATGPTYRVDYRRKRESKTNYKKRIETLKSGLPRLVIRPSNKHVTVQLVRYHKDGDKVEVTSHSKDLKKHGWTHNTGNVPASYLTGFICGLKGRQKKIEEAIMDLGMNTSVKGSRIYAALKGALDGGIKVNHDGAVLPSEDRLKGTHIASYVKKSKDIASDLAKIKEKVQNDYGKQKS
ncbi:MAG: 50S ribosomal protein L18 [Candidatus Altiarchaeales archaeon]|nr:50S ribosomal protein L18 [Candidatus Altiarchaeales archaeon]